MNGALQALASEEFGVSLGVCGTVRSLRRCLQRSPVVKAVRRSLATGEITEGDVRSFVRRLMREFKAGVQFQNELALSALAVALETWYTPFADEYLLDLARLGDVAELENGPRIARACRREWGAGYRAIEERKRNFILSDSVAEHVSDFWMVRGRSRLNKGRGMATILTASMACPD